MTCNQSLSKAMIRDDNDTIRWQLLPHCMTDWGKITKVYGNDSELTLHIDGNVYVGQFYYFIFGFIRDPRFVVPVSKKTTAFEYQPSKN